jgi:hypothetical protein
MKSQYLININYNSETSLYFNINSGIIFDEMRISISDNLQSTNFDDKLLILTSNLVDNQIIGTTCDQYNFGIYNFSKILNSNDYISFFYKNKFYVNQNIRIDFQKIDETAISNITGKIYILLEFINFD